MPPSCVLFFTQFSPEKTSASAPRLQRSAQVISSSCLAAQTPNLAQMSGVPSTQSSTAFKAKGGPRAMPHNLRPQSVQFSSLLCKLAVAAATTTTMSTTACQICTTTVAAAKATTIRFLLFIPIGTYDVRVIAGPVINGCVPRVTVFVRECDIFDGRGPNLN